MPSFVSVPNGCRSLCGWSRSQEVHLASECLNEFLTNNIKCQMTELLMGRELICKSSFSDFARIVDVASERIPSYPAIAFCHCAPKLHTLAVLLPMSDWLVVGGFSVAVCAASAEQLCSVRQHSADRIVCIQYTCPCTLEEFLLMIVIRLSARDLAASRRKEE